MANVKITLCRQALVLAGAKPISTLDGPGAEQVACAELFPMVRDDLMSRYTWRFCRDMVALQRLTAAPAARWASAFQLPTGYADGEVHAVLVNDAAIIFDREGTRVVCDAREEDTVYADLRFVPDEARWPKHFCTVFVFELASHLAITLAEDTAKSNTLAARALRAFSQAKTNDSQSRTTQKLPVGGLRRWHGGRP